MRFFPIKVFKIRDRSMEPSIRDGDYVFANSWYWKLKEEDLVVLKHPKKDILILKRIDEINGGKAFLTGDNLNDSEDSRRFGSVDLANIIGKVFFSA